MKVWIDLDNSPHVLFFAPIIGKLEQDGAEVIVTVRSLLADGRVSFGTQGPR